MPKPDANFYERWEWILKKLSLEDKIVHNALLYMEKKFNSKVSVLGITEEDKLYTLTANPKAITFLTDEQVIKLIIYAVEDIYPFLKVR